MFFIFFLFNNWSVADAMYSYGLMREGMYEYIDKRRKICVLYSIHLNGDGEDPVSVRREPTKKMEKKHAEEARTERDARKNVLRPKEERRQKFSC